MASATIAALAAGGLANPAPEDVTFEADEAERDVFFASLRACDIGDGAPTSGGPAKADRSDGDQSVAGEDP